MTFIVANDPTSDPPLIQWVYHDLSDTQENVLFFLPFPSTILSLIGSSTIIYLAYGGAHNSPYKRLLVGMSVCDLLFTSVYAFSGLMLPKETSLRPFAMGNDASCSVSGFFYQFSFAAYIYNACLSFFFLLTVRYGWTAHSIKQQWEKPMHFLALGYPLVTGIVGAVMGVYGEVELTPVCWVDDYPRGCEQTEDAPSCLAPLIGAIFSGVPVFLSLIAIIINNLAIYCHVRSTIRRGKLKSSHRVLEIRAGKKSKRDNQDERIRAVAMQGFFYVLAFVMSYIWVLIMGSIEGTVYSIKQSTLYPLNVLQQIFAPINGFSNMLVYIRPIYVRTRSTFPKESRWWAFKRSIWGDRIQRTVVVNKTNTPTDYNFGQGDVKQPSKSVLSANTASTTTNTTEVAIDESQAEGEGPRNESQPTSDGKESTPDDDYHGQDKDTSKTDLKRGRSTKVVWENVTIAEDDDWEEEDDDPEMTSLKHFFDDMTSTRHVGRHSFMVGVVKVASG